MTTGENKRKHLEFIQDAINRMARNSFMLKGWTVLVVAAMFAFIARGGDEGYMLLGLIPVAAFWFLDGFFLSQERLFRALYDHVRTLDEASVDFSMDTSAYKGDKRNTLASAMFSRTLLAFYLTIGVIVLLVPVSEWSNLW